MGTVAKTPEKKAEYPLYQMEGKGKLILPPEIIAQITYLHSHCAGKEWSGLLLYDVEGNPSKPETFVLTVKHIFLMDIGTAGFTAYEPDEDIVDLFDEIPEAMNMKLGHVHTHHSGAAYFSGTDTDELQINVDKYNYYLSLVVCHSGNYAAKVVFLSDMHTTSKMNYKDDGGEIKHFKQTKIEKHMVVIDMRVFYAEMGGFFSDRLDQIKKKIEEAAKVPAVRGYGGHHNSHFSNPNHQLPAHNQRAISSKVIPDKMTSWEIEKLTKNVLLFDTELKTETNVYAILHQIVKETEQMDLFYDYLLNHIEPVMEAFFDVPLADDEYIVVIKEMIMCVKKYEAIPVLNELIGNLEDTFEQFMHGYEGNVADQGEQEIADQLTKMENEL